jgi:hypothetical protein
MEFIMPTLMPPKRYSSFWPVLILIASQLTMLSGQLLNLYHQQTGYAHAIRVMEPKIGQVEKDEALYEALTQDVSKLARVDSAAARIVTDFQIGEKSDDTMAAASVNNVNAVANPAPSAPSPLVSNPFLSGLPPQSTRSGP